MSPARVKTGGPIFVVGSMGSGTTLLRLILDSHENIAIAQETGFIRAILANKYIPFWKWGGVWSERLGWSDAEFDAELSEFYGRLFRRFAEQQGKSRWGDKTPFHVWHMSALAHYFPDAVFIGIVRHPGAVANSVRSRFSWSWRKSVMHWVRSYLQLVDEAAKLGDRVLLCRYEDLVLQPEPLMREMLQWLDEPWSQSVLEHDRVHGDRGTPQEVEGQTRSTDPLDPARISKWLSTTNAEGWSLLRTEADALSTFFGYAVDDPAELKPFGADASRFVLTGSEVAARRGQHPSVDWSFKPAASMANQLLTPKALKKELTRVEAAAVARARPSRGGPPSGKPAARRGQPPSSLSKRIVKRLPPVVQVRVRRAVAAFRKA